MEKIRDKLKTVFLPGLLVAAVAALVACQLIYVRIGNYYRDIAAAIEVQVRYYKPEQRKEAIDRCLKILEDNGFVMWGMDVRSHGGWNYVAVSGFERTQKKKYEEKTE